MKISRARRLPVTPALKGVGFVMKDRRGIGTCGCGSVAEHQPSKLTTPVRFRSSARRVSPGQGQEVKLAARARACAYGAIRPDGAVSPWPGLIFHALLTQLAEYLALNQGVQGSSPWRRTWASSRTAYAAASNPVSWCGFESRLAHSMRYGANGSAGASGAQGSRFESWYRS